MLSLISCHDMLFQMRAQGIYAANIFFAQNAPVRFLCSVNAVIMTFQQFWLVKESVANLAGKDVFVHVWMYLMESEGKILYPENIAN